MRGASHAWPSHVPHRRGDAAGLQLHKDERCGRIPAMGSEAQTPVTDHGVLETAIVDPVVRILLALVPLKKWRRWWWWWCGCGVWCNVR